MTSKTRNILAISLLALCGTASATNYGPELVTDGGFDNGDASWAMGYSWQAIPGPLGVAFHNEGYNWSISQATVSVTPGMQYEASYTITGSYTSSNPGHQFRLRGDSNASCPIQYGDGTFTCQLIAPANVHTLMIRPLSGFAGVLDDVSLREVLP